MNKAGQSFLDRLLQQTGTVENAFEMALENGVSITDDLVIGLSLNTSGVIKKSVTEIFINNEPATALQNEFVISQSGGIDYMGIENDFIVT